MENQYYYKLMANYLSKRNCDDSFMKYFFGKYPSKKTPEEIERADERKRRLQRERSRRYRALKNARRQSEMQGRVVSGSSIDASLEHSHSAGEEYGPSKLKSANHRAFCALSRPLEFEEESCSEGEEPPTLYEFDFDDKWKYDKKLGSSAFHSGSESVSDENSTHSFSELKDSLLLPGNIAISLKDFLSIPASELDYPTVHSLMFQWMQT